MLKIRFQRTGRKNDPSFRIVVGEHTKHPKSGSHAETLGAYHPKTKELTLNEAGVKQWIEKGAKPSPTVHNLLVSKGIIEGTKINVLPKKTPIVKEEVKEETPEAEATEAPSEEEVVADESTESQPAEGAEAPVEEKAEEAPAEEEKKEEPAA